LANLTNVQVCFFDSLGGLKLYAHGMRPMRFLSACVWSAFRAEPVSILTHQTHSSSSILLERRPYQTHQKRTWRHKIRRIRPKTAQDACRLHRALVSKFFDKVSVSEVAVSTAQCISLHTAAPNAKLLVW